MKVETDKNPQNNMLEEETLETSAFRENVFQYRLGQRDLILNRDINDSCVEYYMMQILSWNEEDSALIPSARIPITIYINCDGGDVYTGLVLCNIIKQSITPVCGIVLGSASSMGALVLIACHYRYSYTFGNVMLHQCSLGVNGDLGKVTDVVDFVREKKNAQIKRFILDNTKVSEALLDQVQLERREWWLTAEEALMLGVIDEIIGFPNVEEEREEDTLVGQTN